MYENVTYEALLDRMLARISDKFDKREGSVIWDTHSPTAIELQILYIELDTILREAYGDTASREFLILRCKERGITPYLATQAVLKGKFTPVNIDVVGKRFNIGSVNYIVTEKITDGEYQVVCETTGIVGNQYFGNMTPIDYIAGLETAELIEVLIPGEDDEDTEALRQRYFDSFDEKAFGGNVKDYIEKTNAIHGVGKTKVTRVWNADISPAEMIPTETVKSWYGNIMNSLTGEAAAWLSLVYKAASEKKLTVGGTILLTILNSDFAPASDVLVQKVQEAIDPEVNAGEGYGFAPIGHIVTVQSAKGIEIEVKTDITFDTGYGWDNLQSFIDTAISDYLLELRKTWADSPYLIVRISQLETRILNIQGIVDVQNTYLNGSEENLALEKYEVPIFGSVSA